MSGKKIGRPAGITKTKKSVTIDSDVLAESEALARRKRMSLSSLIESLLEDLLAAKTNSEEENPSPIVDFTPKPHLYAAAGSPIDAEVEEWGGINDTVLVRLSGLSMEPLWADGQLVTMRHKRAAKRGLGMKKGLIYLVRYDGGFTVKRYNTRPAKPEEAGEEWVENGKVKILQSENPEYPEIVIKQEIEWIAWTNKDGTLPVVD